MTATPAVPAPRSSATHPARLSGFLALTFAISWLSWATALLLGGDLTSPVVFAFFALGGAGPSLAALSYRLRGIGSPRMARGGSTARWLPVAIACAAAPAVLAAVLAPVFGAPALTGAEPAAVLAENGGLLVFLATSAFAGPLSEEFGWRGYLQPRLRTRFSPLATALVLGTIWALWHTPLFLLAGTWQSGLGLGQGLGFLVAMVPMSLTYWFVSERLRGGVPGAVVFHLVGNVMLTLLPFTALASGVVFLATVLVIALVVLLLPGSGARSSARLVPWPGRTGVRTEVKGASGATTSRSSRG